MAKWFWLAGALLALSACGHEPEREPAAASLPAGDILRLAPKEMAELKAVGAEIATRDQAEALARIPGVLASLSVRAGDEVTATLSVDKVRLREGETAFEDAMHQMVHRLQSVNAER